MAFLSNELITLRAPEPADIDFIFRWENDTSLWEYGVSNAPLSRQQVYDYVSNYDGDIFTARQLRLMITLNATGEVVGTLDITDFDPLNRRASVGILVIPQWQRCGIATAALSLAGDYARSCLAVHSLWCIVAVDNMASRRLFDKAGYKSTGLLKSWLYTQRGYKDAYILQRVFQ